MEKSVKKVLQTLFRNRNFPQSPKALQSTLTISERSNRGLQQEMSHPILNGIILQRTLLVSHLSATLNLLTLILLKGLLRVTIFQNISLASLRDDGDICTMVDIAHEH